MSWDYGLFIYCAGCLLGLAVGINIDVKIRKKK